MATKTYAGLPVAVDRIQVACTEMMFYQYLPVKLVGGTEIKREWRLRPFDELIGRACCDFVGAYGLDRFVASNIYLTVKHLYQSPGCPFNRPGYHSDGFMTDDVQYIWSNRNGTIFNGSQFVLTLDDELSMREMERQADPYLDYTFPDCTLVRMDERVIHRVAEPQALELRTFFKLSFSADRYDLEGNSINGMLAYDWPMRKRLDRRNVPQRLG